ncbi:MAG: amidohydrolase [Clostridia bacterium]|nr:amidohydrolase [Clostridia bacterium]
MKDLVKNSVLKFKQEIYDAQDYIWANAETGYREVKTSKYMADIFEKLGYKLNYADNIPGFYTVIDTGREGPEILILAELDSVINFSHPDCNKETGAIHCCGHSAQCAAMVGIAGALTNPEILEKLSGRIRLCLVPAEELIEIEYRNELIKKGIIKYLGGKAEFLSRGYFDGVDLAFMVHTSSNKHFCANTGGVGCLAKNVTYKGVSAHAGGSPWNGVNALYSATQGLSAINAIRETFKEQDIIRVHPIITKGGGAVNAIPDEVVIESYVRGSSFDAIKDANRKVNRALVGSALSLGANVDIKDTPGYAPYINDELLLGAYEQAIKEQGYEFVNLGVISSGSTDMGDLRCIMPAIHPYAPGAVGISHGENYYIENKDLACVGSAIVQIQLLCNLLKDGASLAKEIIKNSTVQFKSKEDYLAYLDTFNSSGDRIEYLEDKAIVKL